MPRKISLLGLEQSKHETRFSNGFSRVTEGAALAGYKWLGRGDKNAADGAAVEVMRILLNQTEISGEIVIGEGEIDEAPMLYIGEQVGLGAMRLILRSTLSKVLA